MPAAAVIRGWQALSGFIGRKAFAGGDTRSSLKTRAQRAICGEYDIA
ncbi:MAG: hypothetical protein HYW78_03415 [Parcubacteria group bacterium]|nr:hypothetical protein [Parcubacteria group bacterium]